MSDEYFMGKHCSTVYESSSIASSQLPPCFRQCGFVSQVTCRGKDRHIALIPLWHTPDGLKSDLALEPVSVQLLVLIQP